ncbi:hypothetical protein ACOZ4I_12850 [Haloarcula salina]|uniref:hypothetical protein n=1 Tax=Haloarcula salina TaxID=1429914 RepID=UPI003C6EADF0
MQITIQISDDSDEGVSIEGIEAAESVQAEPPAEPGESAAEPPVEMNDVERPPAQFRRANAADEVASQAEPAPPQFSPASSRAMEKYR